MLIQMCLQTCDIPSIEKINGPAKQDVLDSLRARELESIGWSWFFNVGFQTGPAWKSMFAGDRKLSIGKAQWRGEDFRVGGIVEAGVEFADALSCFEVVRDMTLAEVFGLVFEVVKTGI